MKKIISIVSLILTFVLVLGLSACTSGAGSADSIVGTWETSIDLTDMVADSVGDSVSFDLAELDAKLTMPLSVQFTEAGTAIFSIDAEEFSASAQTFLSSFIDCLCEEVYKQMEEEDGMSREDVDSAFEVTYGCDVKTYMQETFGTADFSEIISGDETEELKYSVDGDKLYLYEGELSKDVAALTFTLKGNQLTLNDPAGAYLDLLDGLIVFPVTFQKAA